MVLKFICCWVTKQARKMVTWDISILSAVVLSMDSPPSLLDILSTSLQLHCLSFAEFVLLS